MRTATATSPPPPVERIPGGGAGSTRSRETVVRIGSDPACASSDPELFFAPDNERDPAEREYREAAAVKVCAGCPVQLACLEGALNRREHYGVWGGLTEEQVRRAVKRHRREELAAAGAYVPTPPPRVPGQPAPCGTEAAYQRHVRNAQPVDVACREAHNADARERYQRRVDAEELAS